MDFPLGRWPTFRTTLPQFQPGTARSFDWMVSSTLQPRGSQLGGYRIEGHQWCIPIRWCFQWAYYGVPYRVGWHAWPMNHVTFSLPHDFFVGLWLCFFSCRCVTQEPRPMTERAYIAQHVDSQDGESVPKWSHDEHPEQMRPWPLERS